MSGRHQQERTGAGGSVETYTSGTATHKDTARQFNEAGLGARHRAPKLNRENGARPWTGDSIRSLIQNPTYRGVVTRKGEELPARHEAIVSEDLWHRANAVGTRLRGRSTAPGPERFYPLAAIIKCAGCGNNLQGNHTDSGRGYRYYRETGCPPRRRLRDAPDSRARRSRRGRSGPHRRALPHARRGAAQGARPAWGR